MAERRDYYFRQLVTEAELDAGFSGLEVADRNLMIDLGHIGIVGGLGVSAQVSPNLTVQVASGVAYDQLGQRCSIPSTQNLDCSVDEDSVSTTVSTPGNSRILGVFIGFQRSLTDLRIDGNSDPVYFVRGESFELRVIQGGEAVNPTAPPLQGDAILLADITRSHGVTTIGSGDISTTRRQTAFKTTGIAVSAGQPEEALQALIAALQAAGGLTYLGALTGTSEINYSTPRTRTFKIGLRDFLAASGTTATYQSPSLVPNSEQWTIATNFGTVECDLTKYLKHGEVIKNVRAIVDPGAIRTGGNRTGLYLNIQPSPNFATPASNPVAPTTVFFCLDDGLTANKQVLSLLAGGGTPGAIGAGHTVIREGATAQLYVLSLLAGSTAGAANDVFYGVEVVVESPGLRTH